MSTEDIDSRIYYNLWAVTVDGMRIVPAPKEDVMCKIRNGTLFLKWKSNCTEQRHVVNI